MKYLPAALLLLAVSGTAQNSVPWDSSGNGLLQGAYNFRQVLWVLGESGGNLRRSVAFTGAITFDGGGTYRLRAAVIDSNASGEQSLNIDGTYTISASGYGFLSNPAAEGGRVYGAVSQGIFIGSSTEDPFSDLFIAAPAASPAPTNAGFNGRFWVAEMNFPALTIAQARDALYQLNPDGQGALGTVNATGYIGDRPAVTQTVSGVRYSFQNGVATLTFGGTLSNQNLLAGTRLLFLSPDGNFIFGGSATGWDMFVGVRAVSGTARPDLLSGLYYQAGVDLTARTLSEGSAETNTYYGAFSAEAGLLLGHQRLFSNFKKDAYDYTYSDSYEVQPDGTFEDFLGFRNIMGANGGIRIGFGQQGVPGINVAIRLPGLTGEGVFINPAGVVNGASYAPFTVGISPGQLIQISGANLAAETASDAAYPNTLAGVQVRINDRLAPIGSVSPQKITALVPFATIEPIARIQVLSGGVESNAVTAFVNTTTPGVFTVPPGGAGFANAIHADSSAVTRANPARPGESITLLVTGLGSVSPEVPDGAPGPAGPPSRALADIAVRVDGDEAKVSFAGLAEGATGVYHTTFTVPSNLEPGDLYVDVATPDAITSQAQIPVERGARDGLEPRTVRRSVDGSAATGRFRGRPARQLTPGPIVRRTLRIE